jgi:O-antigen/teichoic acid export membrane protein
VVLNLVFVPRFGIIASAWATAITELLVVLACLTLLRGRAWRLLRAWARVSAVPVLVAVATIMTPALLLGRDSLVALVAGGVLYAVVMTVAGAWPAELVALVRRRSVPS